MILGWNPRGGAHPRHDVTDSHLHEDLSQLDCDVLQTKENGGRVEDNTSFLLPPTLKTEPRALCLLRAPPLSERQPQPLFKSSRVPFICILSWSFPSAPFFIMPAYSKATSNILFIEISTRQMIFFLGISWTFLVHFILASDYTNL